MNTEPQARKEEQLTTNCPSIWKPDSALQALASNIREELDQAAKSSRSALRHAINAGHLLREAKAKIQYGGWSAWLRENFSLSERTAQNYMQLAAHEEVFLNWFAANPQRAADLTVRGALTLLRNLQESQQIETGTSSRSVRAARSQSAVDKIKELNKGMPSDCVAFLGIPTPDDPVAKALVRKMTEWSEQSNCKTCEDDGALMILRSEGAVEAPSESDESAAGEMELD